MVTSVNINICIPFGIKPHLFHCLCSAVSNTATCSGGEKPGAYTLCAALSVTWGPALLRSHFLPSEDITGCSLRLEFSLSLLSSHLSSKVTVTGKAPQAEDSLKATFHCPSPSFKRHLVGAHGAVLRQRLRQNRRSDGSSGEETTRARNRLTVTEWREMGTKVRRGDRAGCV